MTIRTSIYDFFAYAVPGGLFLLNLLAFLNLFHVLIDIKIIYISSELSIVVVFVITSYIIGHLTAPIYRRWTKLFEAGTISTLAMDAFKKAHPNIKIEIDSSDWQIWFASIRRESEELKVEIDRMMATSYFLRGVSFNLVILAFVLIVGVVNGNFAASTLVGIPFVLLCSYISVRQSIKFNKWFYFQIYEIIISRNYPFNSIDNLKKTSERKSDDE